MGRPGHRRERGMRPVLLVYEGRLSDQVGTDRRSGLSQSIWEGGSFDLMRRDPSSESCLLRPPIAAVPLGFAAVPAP